MQNTSTFRVVLWKDETQKYTVLEFPAPDFIAACEAARRASIALGYEVYSVEKTSGRGHRERNR